MSKFYSKEKFKLGVTNLICGHGVLIRERDGVILCPYKEAIKKYKNKNLFNETIAAAEMAGATKEQLDRIYSDWHYPEE
ncbi:MAG: hypothetical protein AABY32_00695 [Nanoarchaeota archaeon]